MSGFGRPLGWQALRQTGRIAAAAASVGPAFGVVCALLIGLAAPVPAAARRSVDPPQMPSVPLATLPTEAQATYRAIYAGGPFRYAKDGSVFGNRERSLPRQPRGYYHEYTVRTIGSRDRGARRIVCGGLPPTEPAACYYTADHYASFQLIAR